VTRRIFSLKGDVTEAAGNFIMRSSIIYYAYILPNNFSVIKWGRMIRTGQELDIIRI
jgi:hypothetical protein